MARVFKMALAFTLASIGTAALSGAARLLRADSENNPDKKLSLAGEL